MKNMFGIHRFTVVVGKNMSWHKKPPVLNKNFSRCKKLLVLFYHKMSRGEKFVVVGVKISRQQEVFLTEERPYPHLLLHRSAGPALPQPVDNL